MPKAITLSRAMRMTVSAHGGVILDTQKGKFYDVNPVGVAIIQLLSRGHAVEEILQDLHRKWPTSDPRQLSDDFMAFLADMRTKGLINLTE